MLQEKLVKVFWKHFYFFNSKVVIFIVPSKAVNDAHCFKDWSSELHKSVFFALWIFQFLGIPMARLPLICEMHCAIRYHLNNFKNVKNTHRRMLISVKLQVEACNFTKINIPPWVFFTFFKLYKWYQIAQRITYVSHGKLLSMSSKTFSNFRLFLFRELQHLSSWKMGSAWYGIYYIISLFSLKW